MQHTRGSGSELARGKVSRRRALGMRGLGKTQYRRWAVRWSFPILLFLAATGAVAQSAPPVAFDIATIHAVDPLMAYTRLIRFLLAIAS